MRHTEETKQKLSAMRRGPLNPFYGKKHTEEFKARARLILRDHAGKSTLAPQRLIVPIGITAAYLAGMIDADGSVRFRRGRPFVAVYNTYKPLIDWLVKTLGCGSVSKGNMGRELVQAWCITAARDVHALLGAVRPHLIVKAGDADAALAHLRDKYEWAK